VKETLPIPIDALNPLGDGEGNVLTGVVSGRGALGYKIYTRNGQLIGEAGLGPPNEGFTISLSSGFAGVGFLSAAPGTLPALVRVMPDGGVQNIAALQAQTGVTAADPRGGLVLLADDVLTAYDDEMIPRWALPLPVPGLPGVFLPALGVDVAGNVLILFGATARVYDLQGLWVDAAGNPGTTFLVAPQLVIDENEFRLTPDVRGGLFLWHQFCPDTGAPCTSEWQSRYPALSTSPEQVPDWLSSKPFVTLRLLKGTTAYALAGAPVPACAFEVATADGVSCGVADFSGALASSPPVVAHLTANAGGTPACRAALEIGRDGTVLSVRSRATGVPCSETGDCPVSWDWFPAYFR
jgi:hypothetical protein